jgi:hypothetical protein
MLDGERWAVNGTDQFHLLLGLLQYHAGDV